MSEIVIVLICIFVGFFNGIMAGLFGIGGGLVFVPTLVLLLPSLGVEPSSLYHTAIATSLLAGSFASISSFVNHNKKKNVQIDFSLLLSAGSMVTALLLPAFVVKVEASSLKYIMTIILTLAALKMIFEKDGFASKFKLNKYFALLIGLFTGALSVFTGLGGGVIYVPVLAYLFSFDFKKAIGTSSLAVVFTMVSSSIAFALFTKGNPTGTYQIGFVNYLTGTALGCGAVFGAIYGVKLVFKSSVKNIKRAFAAFLILVILKVILFK